MRYTKAALSTFGLGLVLGFVVVVGEFARFERVASALMALGLVLLPAGLFADGRGMAVLGWLAARFRRCQRARPHAKSRSAAAGRKPQVKRAARTPRRKRSG